MSMAFQEIARSNVISSGLDDPDMLEHDLRKSDIPLPENLHIEHATWYLDNFIILIDATVGPYRWA